MTTLFVFTYDSPDRHLAQRLRPPKPRWSKDPTATSTAQPSSGGRQNGGSSALGTIFKMSPAGALLGSFPVYGVLDIAIPNAPLVLGTDGAFYSTSYNSGGVRWRRRGLPV